MARTKQTARKSTGGKMEQPPGEAAASNIPAPPPVPPTGGSKQELKRAFSITRINMEQDDDNISQGTFSMSSYGDEDLYNDDENEESNDINPAMTEALKIFPQKKSSFGKGGPAKKRDTASMPNRLSLVKPTDLIASKKNLKSINRRIQPVDLTRSDILQTSTDFGALNLSECMSFLKTQSQTADVISLTFSGTDQMTDVFWMLVKQNNIHFSAVKRISLSGCYNLTNAGIRWMTQCFSEVSYVDLAGCVNLSEESLYFIMWAWSNSLVQVDLSGTNVGLIKPNYSGDVTMKGCPLVSPSEATYKTVCKDENLRMRFGPNPVTEFKMVFLTDDSVPWSPMDVFRGSNDIKTNKSLKVKTKFQLKGTPQINMFEVPIDSGFADLLVTKGSIVVIPYILAADGPDPDYPDIIVANILSVFTKCPDVMVLLLGLASETGCESVADRYGNLITKQLEKKCDLIEKGLYNSTQSEVMVGRLLYNLQLKHMAGRVLYDRGMNLVESHNNEWRLGKDQLLSQSAGYDAPKLLLSASLNVEAKDNTDAVRQIIGYCTTAVQHHFPWYFMNHGDQLKQATVDLSERSFDLTSVNQLTNTLKSTSRLWSEFSSHQSSLKAMVSKILDVMSSQGSVLFFPDVEGGCCLNNYAFLTMMYTKLVGTKSERRSSWRYIGTEIPCWTNADLKEICPDDHTRMSLIKLLESRGIILQLPRDQWTKDYDQPLYVLYKHLPYYPNIDLEDVWPDGVPSDEHQLERYISFFPGAPRTFFPCVIRECLQLDDVILLWNKGVLVRKGPITLLLELLTTNENRPCIFLGARCLQGSESVANMAGGVFKIYKAVVEAQVQKFGLYTTVVIPCVTCHPPKNRYKTINSRSSEIFLVDEQYLNARTVIMRTVTCGNDGSKIDPSILGHKETHLRDLVPNHHYLGCLPTFSAYNRCLFCKNCAFAGATCPGNLTNGRTAWNCSCDREGQMCDSCGLCQRCVTQLSRIEGAISPKFQKGGSIVSLHSAKDYVFEQDLTPNASPVVEIMPLRGSNLVIECTLGSEKLQFDISAGTISLLAGSRTLKEQSDSVFKCKEGYRISLRLNFSEVDLDEMTVDVQIKGDTVFSHPTSTQSCSVTVKSQIPSSAIVFMPSCKRLYEAKTDNFGEKAMCSYITGPLEGSLKTQTPASCEAHMLQGKQYVENALFQAGGVNYSGSTYLPLPVFTEDVLRFPSSQAVKQDTLFHLLCYTRSKISDVLSFGGGQAVPESWSVYRMLHLVNAGGVKLSAAQQLALTTNAGHLLWGWVFIYKLLPEVQLPKEYDLLVPEEIKANFSTDQLTAGLHGLLDVSFWNLMSKLNIEEILPMYEDTVKLLDQTQKLQKITSGHLQQTACLRTESKFNPENILYLCSGHHASMMATESLTQVLPEVYGIYSHFLLSVDMPSNQLTEIPEKVFEALPNLAEFDCSRNFIEVLPASIKRCTKLYSLNVSDNNLTDLPLTLQECTDLYRLDISGNMMDKIPEVVTKMKQLQRLYASYMFLQSLPHEIGNLVNLEKLYVNGNCLSKLPASFAKLQSLSDLSIGGVPWLTMAKSKGVMSYENFLKNLNYWRLDRWLEVQEHNGEKEKLFQFFDKDGNGLLDQEEKGKLNAYLFNMFPRFGYKGIEPPEDDTPSGFPMEILECRSLEYIHLHFQGIVSIPADIGNLQDLKILNISNNPNLLSIPAELGTISCLTRLDLDECPMLKTPPKEIRSKGFSTTFAYLRRLMSGSLPCKRTKLMMVGLGGAGKTSLVKSLMSKDGKADLGHGEAITDGIDISNWTVKAADDETLTFSVWDFAGQTVYYNTHQYFMSNRAVYLLLWNVRLGFEHAGLDFWLSSISVQAPKAPIFVVGSHVDQVNKFELPIAEMKLKYKQIVGFHFVSSFTGQGIKELQNSLFDVTLQQQYMGEQIPEVWLTLENNVISARSSCDIIEFSALEKMANLSGIFDVTEIHQAIQFLHDLGSLQHFTTETLKSKVVINPQWIVDVMACVVSVKNSPIERGRLKHSDIKVVWKDYPADLHDWLLGLTEVFDLTFRLDDEPVNLVPCLLPEKASEYQWPELEKNLGIRENKMVYRFAYLPAGLFNRGQVRLHQISDSALLWKRGSFLKKNGHIALLQQSRDSELIVQVQGPRPENILFLVHEVFEGLIAESFRGVTYDFQIPCPDCLKMFAKDPHMFSASTIRRAIEMKSPFLQCITYFHVISCVDLQACMPPDNHTDFDLHLVQSVRNLRDLRKDLVTDIFMSYCSKDAPTDTSSVIHPQTVYNDLIKVGYKCWFPDPKKKHSADEMARAISDASVFLVFMSVDYTKDDDCVTMFKYAKLTLRKPMVVVAVGDNFDFKSSRLGIHLSDEVFVNMVKSKRNVYKTKFEELVSTISSRTNKKLNSEITPSCFFSYTWVNSQQAVDLGTRKSAGALGYGDPREIKKYLEEKGIRCWIDVERVGMNGLFDDIAEGLLSAKVVIVCVSDEYAASPTCQVEFRYAATTLGLPIILAVVGTGNAWRASEVGVLSLKYPLVSFQEKSETAFEKLHSIVMEMLPKELHLSKTLKDKQNEEAKNLSFVELFELAQRKLLRQLTFYAEHQDVDNYPRLFVIDYVESDSTGVEEQTEGKEKGDETEKPETRRHMLRRLKSTDSLGNANQIMSNLKAVYRVQRYCVHTLCEHDEGWHSVLEPIPLPHDFGESQLDKFSPFVARMLAVMKFNKKFGLKCLHGEFGEDFLKWLEDIPTASMSDYQQIYHEFRQMVIEADSHKSMGKLARCRLPNGKIIWLCEKHHRSMKVTLLGADETQAGQTVQGKADDVHILKALRSADKDSWNLAFTSAKTCKRRAEHDLDLKDNVASKNSHSVMTSYDLLPDKKASLPQHLKKSAQGKTEATAVENKELAENIIEEDEDSKAKKTMHNKSKKTRQFDADVQLEPEVFEQSIVQNDNVEIPVKQGALSGKHSQKMASKRPVPADVSYKKPPMMSSQTSLKASDQQSGTSSSNVDKKPELGTRSKTIMPSTRSTLPKAGNQSRPALERAKTSLPSDKPKSKACRLM